MDFIIHTALHISPLLIYLLVVIFLLLESSGIPLVNTTLLLFAGALAAWGRLNIILLICAAIAGSVLGACSAYGLGRRYGEPFLLGLASFLRIDRRKASWAERWFSTMGMRMIFFSRIVPYIRPFACFPAGISSMPFLRFFLSALAGSTIWCIVLPIIGWELGPRWRVAVQLIRDYTLPMIGVLLVLLVAYVLLRYVLNRSFKRHLDALSEKPEPDRDLLEV